MLFCFCGSAEQVEEAAGIVLLSLDIQLFRVDANAFLAMKGSTYIGAPLFIRFVSHANSKVRWKLIIKIGSLGSKNCASFAVWLSSPSQCYNSTLCRHNKMSASSVDKFGSLRHKYNATLIFVIWTKPILLADAEVVQKLRLYSAVWPSLEKLIDVQERRVSFLVDTER